MSRERLSIMPRESFAALTLDQKNSYLQRLAEAFAEANGRLYRPLDKGTLSRLRRYYARRVWADLKLDPRADDELSRALTRLAESIRDGEIKDDLTAVLMQELPGKPVLRPAPEDDAQLMFFVPTVYDAPIKDDVNLMDVAPFALGKSTRTGIIRYELKDSLIVIEGGAEVGIATVFDYDIFLNMVSYLAEEVRRYKRDLDKGLRPDLPPRIYQPTASQLLKFCRRGRGGRQYEEIETALARLKATQISIRNLSRGSRRQVDTRGLIEDFSVVSTTTTGKVDEIRIKVPDWVYNSVVKADKVLPLLTLNPDYFLISSGLGRFIYRLARKAAGKQTATYSARELHKRSGTTQDYRKFAFELRELVMRTKMFPMPDYDLSLTTQRDGLLLTMRRRPEGEAPVPPVLELTSPDQAVLPLASRRR